MATIFKFPEYIQHPIAAKLMPGGMDATEFKALKEDIDEHGVLMPVTLYEGKVLDGWHRYRAARESGCAFEEIEYMGQNPAGYIASVNVLRRKLSSLQRAMVGARLHLEHNMTQRDVCRKLGISNEVVTLVLRVLASKSAVLIKRIEDDSDFTRGMLKDELTDAGLLRKPAAPAPAPVGPNSVFDLGKQTLSAEAARSGIPDTDSIGDDLEPDELLVGKGKKAADRAARKPTVTAAQTLAEGFKALMADEKQSFLKLIWPEAKPLLTEAGLLGKSKK